MWSFFRKQSEEPKYFQANFGTFMKIAQIGWKCCCEIDGEEIEIIADDVRGEPDPALLDYLFKQWGEIPAFARLARDALFCLSDKHRFAMIWSSGQGEVCLGFTWDEEWWGETVYVHFKKGKIVSWDSVD